MRAKKNGFLVLVFFCVALWAWADEPTEGLHNTIMCGYQGWFGAPGDDVLYDMGWLHWCLMNTEPTPDTITFDTWPDYSEYNEAQLFYPSSFNWMYPDGTPAGFFSSNLEETVLLHCKWMRDYGIDGVFIQRFTLWTVHMQIKARYDNVLRYMLKGAEMYGLKVAIMYDVSSTPIRKISPQLTEDWRYLVNVMRVTEHPNYLFHPDRSGERLPVLGVWGLGFVGVGSINQATTVIDFLKNNPNPDYRVTLVGGVPGYWRFGDRDSKPGYESAYVGFDIISPWTVGRFSTEAGAEAWRGGMIDGDMELTAQRGQEYYPVCFPGFSNSNLTRNKLQAARKDAAAPSDGDRYLSRIMKGQLNEIPRIGGHFMWSQFYHWRLAGSKMLYVAMFDEVDEGTAIFKTAPTSQQVPQPNFFLALDADGYSLKSDHFLWLTGSAGFLVKHGLPFPRRQPQRIAEDGFSVRRETERAWLIQKQYAKIEINMPDTAVERVTVYRKVNNIGFREWLTVTRDELNRGRLVYPDAFLEETVEYTYVLVAFDGNGVPVGISDMTRI